MPIVKGSEVNGYIEVTKPVNFKGGMMNLNVNPWGKSYYVDYENGNAAGTGLSPAASMKYLQDAIDAATYEDIIYVRPYQTHAQFVGGDPASIIPESTANWSISHAKWGLSIIGTGNGVDLPANYATNLQGSATVQATPTMLIYAPYVSLENLNFRRGGGTLAGVKFLFQDPGTTASAFGGSVYNCTFWKFSSTATTGALNIDSAWYTSVVKSKFNTCYNGIYVGFTNSTMQGLRVVDCDWFSAATAVNACIKSEAGCTNTILKGLTMNHTIPTGGTNNLYIVLGAASTGLWSNSFIGAADPTIATNTTMNGVLYSQIAIASGETNGGHMVVA